MYSEYEKVKKFLDEAKLLDSTSKKMSDIYYSIVKRNLNKEAVIYYNNKGKKKSYRYSRFNKHIFEIASILSEFMCQKEKHTPIILKAVNGPHWGEIFWAILMCGYKPLLIDAKTSKEATENLILQAKATAIITDDKNNYSILKMSLDSILQEKHHYQFTPIWEDEVYFCSSGTTGDVKLMIFNGENLVHQIQSSLKIAETNKDIMYPKSMGKVRILATIPFHHIFGFAVVFLWYTFYGKTLVFPRSIAPSDIQEVCQKCGVTHVFSVPLFWDSIALSFERSQALETPSRQDLLDKMIGYNTGKLTKEQAGQAASSAVKTIVQNKLLGTKIKFCISGGGYLNSKTATIINGLGYPLYNGFGMTEIGISSVELSPVVEDRLKCSIGKPFFGVEYKVKGNKVNTPGELFVKSKVIHIREIIGGVEKNTEFDSEGFFPTGDIAEFDAINNYYLRGRIKDIIINADGENIFPDELENFFKKLPHVTNFSVLGIETNKKTHHQDVVLVLEVSNSITDEQLKSLIDDATKIGNNLPKGTKIADIYLAKGKIPVANNMKVKRFAIKKAIENKSDEYLSINAKHVKKEKVVFSEETTKNILEPTKDLFSKILILPKFKIENDAHWVNDLGGDSMNYVELIQKIQEKFKITIPEELYGKLVCLNDFVAEIEKELKK